MVAAIRCRLDRPRRLACLLFAVALASPVFALEVSPWPLPDLPDGSAEPNLAATPKGELLLSWIERRAEGGHRLRFARQAKDRPWSAPRTIAEGSDWFVNWADFPAMRALEDGSLWAHTLVKRGPSTYAYDVQLTRSGDGGATWRKPVLVHDDGTASEHGFVSLWPWSRDRLAVAWLDGRNTGGGEGHGAGEGHGGGPMSLRTAVFDGKLVRRAETPLDLSVCDCCQTDSALAKRGPVVAYRGRTDGEIRDIRLVRHDGKRWREPVSVHGDGWHMPACPVNGPAVAARGDQVWVAWYTGAGKAPSIRLARSDDGGASFVAMREIAYLDVLGRVDLAVDAKGVWLSWLEERQGRQSLWLAHEDGSLKGEPERVRVAEPAGNGRGTGFPRLLVRDGVAHLVWTEGDSAARTRLAGARVKR